VVRRELKSVDFLAQVTNWIAEDDGVVMIEAGIAHRSGTWTN
jgi:hypothetical protein